MVGGIDTNRKNEGRRKPHRERREAYHFTFAMKGQRLPVRSRMLKSRSGWWTRNEPYNALLRLFHIYVNELKNNSTGARGLCPFRDRIVKRER